MDPASERAAHVEVARAAAEALRRHFATPGKLPKERAADRAWHATTLWPLSQAVEAAAVMSALAPTATEGTALLKDLLTATGHFWNARSAPPGYDSVMRPPRGVGGVRYYDDNHWVGLLLLDHHRLTGDNSSLRQAGRVFDFVVSGWDSDASHPAPGGVFWSQLPRNHDRNTVSTAGAAQLALRLHAITGDPALLAWGIRMRDWVETSLRAPNGLYSDHIDLGGAIEPTQWTYNQGLMVGANVMVFAATGDAASLVRAQEIADASLTRYAGSGWMGQPPVFNAIFFRNLMLLDAVAPDPRYRAAMATYASELAACVEPATGLVRFQGETHLLHQAALVELQATLALSGVERAAIRPVLGRGRPGAGGKAID